MDIFGGLFSFFSGKTPEDIEKKGDKFVDQNAFGPAKLEYEKALARNKVAPSKDPDFILRIEEKITSSKHSLALAHFIKAEELMEADCFDDAKDRLDLATTLTDDRDLLTRIQALTGKAQISFQNKPQENSGTGQQENDPDELIPDELISDESVPDEFLSDELDEDLDNELDLDEINLDENEVFTALVNALPPEEQEAYPLYGANFIKGFTAMNQGDFVGASMAFKKALDEHGHKTSFIHLELATCLVNQDDAQGAKDLVLEFLNTFSTSTRGWQILGEALWSLGQFDEAMDLFASCPASISQTTDMEILRGETLVRSNRLEEAEALYRGALKAGNRDDAILRHLASTCELLGNNRNANELYLELINHCSSCGSRPDAGLRLRFAETSMALGEISDKLLDIYLDLATQDPENKAHYFQRVSQIYEKSGEETQAERFRQFARE